jgi:hypothetical protein
MTDQSIFNGNENQPATQPNQSAAQPAQPVQTPDPIADLLASVKNERGEAKYRDVTEALNGLKHAQEYIPSLKNELSAKDQALAAALAEVERLKAVEESVRAFTSQPAPAVQPTAPVFDEKKIADLVTQTLTQREVQSAQKANLSTVVTSLQQSFGADAEKVFYDKATELGMSMEEMNVLAAKSPKAVLTMLGVKVGAQSSSVAHIPGSVNSSAYQPRQDSFVGRNNKSAMIGATTEDLQMEAHNSRKMVEELHAAGLTVHDLSDPKVYKKYFK